MPIQLEKQKARLLVNPNGWAEYDALTPEFEIAADRKPGSFSDPLRVARDD